MMNRLILAALLCVALATGAAAQTYLNGAKSIANGGTGATTQTTNGVVYYDGTKLTSGGALQFSGTAVNLTESAGAASPSYNIGADPVVVHPITSSPFEAGATDTNIGVGAFALNAMAVAGATGSAQYNTAFGSHALEMATSTDHITAIGYKACGSLTTSTPLGASSDNTCVGVDSMRFLLTGSANVMVGEHTGTYGSLATGGTILQGTYVGANAGQYAGGSANTAVGYNALGPSSSANPITGGLSAALGSFALQNSITTARNNTAVGSSAGLANTTGHNNTYVGQGVGSTTLTTGANNLLIGTSSAVDAPLSSTSNYIGIGASGGAIISVTGANVASTSATTIAGSLTATGGIGASGGFSASPRLYHTGDYPGNPATSAFTAQTPVATEFYFAEVFVRANCTITGVGVYNSATISGNMKVGLFDSAGNLLATSASTAMAGTSTFQRVAFTGTYAATGPATYYVGVFYDNATVRPNTHTVGNFGTGTSTAQTYATGFTAITPPTTFTTAIGPVATLY